MSEGTFSDVMTYDFCLLQTDSINSANSLEEGEAQVVVQSLQEELIMVRLKEAENSAVVKNLRNKIEELEQVCMNRNL